MPALEILKRYLRRRADGGIALAFSGGINSSLLLAVLGELYAESPFPLLALTVHSIFQPDKTTADIQKAADQAGVELKLFGCDPLAIPELKYNPTDRRDRYRRYLFTEIRDFAAARGIQTVVSGRCADDRGSVAGKTAFHEDGIPAPLAELGITGTEVRKMAAELRLNGTERLSAPCMATRFEPGSLLTEDLIRKVIDGEDLIRRLVPGVENLRLRVHAEIARIEVPSAFFSAVSARHDEITGGLKKLGFRFVTLDLEGFRPESTDDVETLCGTFFRESLQF